MRPMYESVGDRTNEARVAAFLADRFCAQYHKLPLAYRADYLFFRGDVVVAVVEIKCRTHAYGTFPTYILSLDKFMRVRELAKYTHAKASLFVQYTDKLVGVELDSSLSSDWDIRWGGRTDRSDTQDQEPVVHIPLTQFVELG